jgi:hypothetical protein
MSSGHKLWFTLPSGNPYSCLYLAFICNVPSWSRNYIDIEVGSLTGSGIRFAHSKASSDPKPQGQQATGAADILPVELSRELFEADVGHSPRLENPRGGIFPTRSSFLMALCFGPKRSLLCEPSFPCPRLFLRNSSDLLNAFGPAYGN